MGGLHPAMQSVLSRLAVQRAGLPSRYEVPFAQARAQLESERAAWRAPGPACPTVERAAQSDGRSFGMRVYQPPGASPGRLLVYLHGGGWCVGSPATHDSIVRRLACGLNCEAWSIDYALAPEAPYPAGLLDCLAATALAARERCAARLIVAGDSAGANLALEVALRLRDQGRRIIDSLLLFYGVYTRQCSGTSMAAYGDGRYGLSRQAHLRYLEAYAPVSTQGDGAPRFPLDTDTDLRGLPPCWLTAAELDILRDQSHEMTSRLRQAGTQVELQEIPGVIHGFLSYGLALAQANEALDAAAKWVLQAAPRPGIRKTPPRN
jgi:acetyl esterase